MSAMNSTFNWRLLRQGPQNRCDEVIQIFVYDQDPASAQLPWYETATNRKTWKELVPGFVEFWKLRLSRHARIGWQIKPQLKNLKDVAYISKQYDLVDDLTKADFDANNNQIKIHDEALMAGKAYIRVMSAEELKEAHQRMTEMESNAKRSRQEGYKQMEEIMKEADGDAKPARTSGMRDWYTCKAG